MEKAGTVAKDILQELVVQGAESAIVSDESTTAIRYMNRYMTMLDAQGVKLGYAEVTNLSDDITIPSGALMGMIKNVAIMLAPQFDVPVSADLKMAADQGLQAMYTLGAQQREMAYPGTLPIGSGNEGFFSIENDHFYPDQQNTIRTEDNQLIEAESETP